MAQDIVVDLKGGVLQASATSVFRVLPMSQLVAPCSEHAAKQSSQDEREKKKNAHFSRVS